MPRVCILIAASPNAAFFSQIAATARAMQQLGWSRWEWNILASFSGEAERAVLDRWLPHLAGVDMTFVSADRMARLPDHWAQSDEVFRLAPRDADVLLAMDADALPVRGFEDLLDEVVATDAVAGVIAHKPFLPLRGDTRRDAWERLAEGLIDAPLDFRFRYTLLDETAPESARVAPFYPNFGFVAFARSVFDRVAPRYLAVRPLLMDRMAVPELSGQAALTLVIAEARAATLALPMRYNFPNDVVADRLYPEELAEAVVFHYLRTNAFDRHRIFGNAQEYEDFLSLPLSGSNLAFQDAVRKLIGPVYPFGSPCVRPGASAAYRP